MRRLQKPARPDWAARVEALGLVWHSANGAPYWTETAYYSFTPDDIARIEQATAALYEMFVSAGQYVIDHNLFARFGIPDWCVPMIRRAWDRSPPCLNYGRFDLGYDGVSPPVLFEFNCDTPTSLLEAAVVQWDWKEDCFPTKDQFNSLHDKLVAKWQDIAAYLPVTAPIYFTHARESTGEDQITTAYLMETARQAGFFVKQIYADQIGILNDRFVDLEDAPIKTLYHLYPWEWLVREPFGRQILAAEDETCFIEPIWKMIWSNKAILPILWDLFPRHPNLLWAKTDRPVGASYVKKPILSREGANIMLVKDGELLDLSDGPYGEGPHVFQGLYDLPNLDGRYPVIGSWCVDGVPAGMGVREGDLITGNLSCFVPHIIESSED